MQDLLLVKLMQGGCQRDGDGVRGPPVEPAGHSGLLEHLGQALALDGLHCDPVVRPVPTGTVDADQTRVSQGPNDHHGFGEPVLLVVPAGQLGPEYLQGDGPVRLGRVLGPEDGSAVSGGDELADLEV
jgi:hypothetical protein